MFNAKHCLLGFALATRALRIDIWQNFHELVSSVYLFFTFVSSWLLLQQDMMCCFPIADVVSRNEIAVFGGETEILRIRPDW